MIVFSGKMLFVNNEVYKCKMHRIKCKRVPTGVVAVYVGVSGWNVDWLARYWRLLEQTHRRRPTTIRKVITRQ